MSAQGSGTSPFKRKVLPLVVLSLSLLVLAIVLMRGPPDTADADGSARIVPIRPDDIALRRDSITWRSSSETGSHSSPSMPRAAKQPDFPPADFPPGSGSASPAQAPAASIPESPLPSAPRSLPHDPTVISAPSWAPPAMRDVLAAHPQGTNSISATQAIAYRQRIAQGEKIFRRAPERKPGVLDGVRGRTAQGLEAKQTPPIHGGVR